ncbi:MAG: hypothetical protein GT598_15800 [Bacteroidales bacterium]|nr:hypothetical protein [Bacteroidales bacterium]HQG57227.1 hypothetical protein [Bacteroidales bacterium]
MKTLKKISAVLALGLILLFIPVSSNANGGAELPEVVISCSASNHGRCYEIRFNWSVTYALVAAECSWTGSPTNNCSLFLVKAYNMIIDYFY